MPIKIPNDLPAFEKLQQEGVRLIGENEALRQDIRPMQVALLNLMPEKPKTETQLARLLGATPLQVELTLLTTSYLSPEHGAALAPAVVLPDLGRGPGAQVRRADHHRRAGRDAAVRGGQVLARADADPRLVAHPRAQLLPHLLGRAGGPLPLPRRAQAHPADQAVRRLHATTSCERHDQHRAGADARLRRLFPGAGLAPHRGPRRRSAAGRPGSRCWRTRTRRACACCTSPSTARSTCSTTSNTTPTRCTTSSAATGRSRADVSLPINYYPDDDPEKAPRNCWRAYAHLLFGNWINEMYQTTPYELARIGQVTEARAA